MIYSLQSSKYLLITKVLFKILKKGLVHAKIELRAKINTVKTKNAPSKNDAMNKCCFVLK